MKRLSKEDWRTIRLALYYAARWEQTVADSWNVSTPPPAEYYEARKKMDCYLTLSNRFMLERRGE